MIPLEKLVINIEQAKHLKELGVAQSSRYYWVNCYSGEPINKWKLVPAIDRDTAYAYSSNYAAFSISEMVVIIEDGIGFEAIIEDAAIINFKNYCYKQLCAFIKSIGNMEDINFVINDA